MANGDLCCFEVHPNLGLENEKSPLIHVRKNRSKNSGKGFDEKRLFFVLLKFGGFEHQGTKSSSRRRAGGNTDQESPEEAAGT